MASIKGLWSEFKAFAFKGNMIDLAVAVVIGGAFGGVVTALVSDIIMPAVISVVSAAKEVKDAGVNKLQNATSAVGLTSQPSTEASPPATMPSALASTEPATQPSALAVAPGSGTAAPELLEEVGALRAEVAALKTAAAAPAADKPPELKAVDIPWNIGPFKIGDFIGQIINFLLIAFAVFVFIVKLLGTVMKKAGGTPAPSEPTTKECPLCLSVIPIKAKRCAHCAADLPVPA